MAFVHRSQKRLPKQNQKKKSMKGKNPSQDFFFRERGEEEMGELEWK
jgi:hypothetical protein